MPPRHGAGALRRDFAARLAALIGARGWNQSETARQATAYMPRDRDTGAPRVFGRDLISKYLMGRNLPDAVHVRALCGAFGITERELLPIGALGPEEGAESAPAGPPRRPDPAGQGTISVTDHDGKNAWVHVSALLPWPVAIEVQQLVVRNKVR